MRLPLGVRSGSRKEPFREREPALPAVLRRSGCGEAPPGENEDLEETAKGWRAKGWNDYPAAKRESQEATAEV